MILTCEKCQTKYMVKEDAIKPSGRSVKCVKCGHNWRQYPEGTTPLGSVEPAPEGIRAVPKGGALPVVQDNSIPFGYKFVACLLLLATFGVTFTLYQSPILRRMPFLEPVYNMVELFNTQGIALQNLAVSQNISNNGDVQYVLRGKLVNSSKDKRVIPSLKITIKDEQKNMLLSFILKTTKETLKPGDVLDFSNNLPDVPEKAFTVTVDLGNKVELALK